MKSNQLKITLEEVVKYCRQENAFQVRVYEPKVQAGKMSKAKANRQYKIIADLGKLAAELHRKGYSYEDFQKIVDGLPNANKRTGGAQSKLFQTNYPVQK